MKRLLLALLLACAPILGPAGCATAPSQRVVTVQSLKAVGESAEAAVALSARLYAGRTITAAQARSVVAFYDNQFQPAFRLAVAVVRADLSQPASPEVAALASRLASMVASFSKP